MKAALLTAPNKMEVVRVPFPECEPGGIVVRVQACAICGSDVRTYLQGGETNVPREWLAGAGLESGRLMGHEFSGVIESVGERCTEFARGERVAVSPSLPCGRCHSCLAGRENICEDFRGLGQHLPGAYAEFVAVPEAALRAGNVHRLPDSLSPDEGALIDPLASVLNGQEKADIRPGESVLVIGAGPIGCMHAALARLSGAVPVILAQRSAPRLELARRLECADAYIDTGREDLCSAVLGLTGGRGCDVVIVACPSRQAQEQSLALVGRGGRIVMFGGLPRSDALITVNGNDIHYREITIHGAFAIRPSHFATSLKLIASGRVPARKYVTNAFPLDGIGEAFSAEVLKRSLKVVIHPS
jgi:L-iditol 2-dehydrogenase